MLSVSPLLAPVVFTTALCACLLGTAFRLDAGATDPVPGHDALGPADDYDADRGYGWVGDTTPAAVAGGGDDPPRDSAVTAADPFWLSLAVPEGTYRVTVVLGDGATPTRTTVKAESRRLCLERVATAPGAFRTASFTVDVRTPDLPDGGRVDLNEREEGTLHWDDRLTLEFSGTRPSVAAVEVEPAPAATTVFLAGDSTVTDQTATPWSSWGQMLPRFFDASVAVANHAESGRTVRSFVAERRWAKVASQLDDGDYLLAQFGHNDMKNGDPSETGYVDGLADFVGSARDRGATPVLVTPPHRRRFTDGTVENTLRDYPDAVRDLADERDVALVDLHAASEPLYEALGPDGSGAAVVDGTHHTAYGGYHLARCVVRGIRRADLDLADALRGDVGRYDPADPHPTPAEWRLPDVTPDPHLPE